MKTTLSLSFTLLAAFALGTTYPMTLHKVVDEQGIHGVAYQYLAPKGWIVQTKLFWTDAILQPTVLTARADSPDGRFGYSFFPGVDFPFGGVTGGPGAMHPIPNRTNGTPPPDKGSDWLLQLVSGDKTIQDVQTVSRKDEPIPAEELGHYRTFGQMSEMQFSFTKNGRPLVGTIVARFDGSVRGNPKTAFQPYTGDWQVTNAFAYYGPKGEEKKALRFFSLAVPTYTATSEFIKARGAYIDALGRRIQVNIRRAGELSKLNEQLDVQKRDAIMGRFRQETGARDQAMSKYCDYIRDVDRYHGPDGEVELASGYKGAWTDGHGNYVLGDDVSSPPDGWTQLQKG